MDLDSAIRKLREDSERETATSGRTNPAPSGETEDPGKLSIRSITEVAGQAPSAAKHAYEAQGHDELQHQMNRHRADIESIEAQLAKLDEAINVEQAKLRDTRASLDQKYHARARLMHVREAMVQFVQVLEAQDAD